MKRTLRWLGAALALLIATAPAHAEAPRARRLALVIGTSHYAAPEWATLTNAASDARAVADLLEQRYGFAATVLLDPDREAFKAALGRAAEAAGEADDLLVFVAGHGYFDPTDKAGYLALGDASPQCGRGCYPLDNVKRALYGTRARHVLVLIDACYAGTFDPSIAFGTATAARGQSAAMREMLRAHGATRSRLITASVGKAPTLDGTPGLAHSPFVRVLLAELGRPGPTGVISVDYLALRLREGPEPLPVIGPTAFPAALPHDVNGTFLFVAEGDLCAALGALAIERRRLASDPPDRDGVTVAPWGTSGAIARSLPGSEGCVFQGFDTDGARVLRCRYGQWREPELSEQRRALDKRISLCGADGAGARTASVCDAQSCNLSVVIE